MTKVSIIVPCWGVEKYLDRCVESLVNQSLRDIEIVLVDDVSPDRVPEMCDTWAEKDSRVRVVHKPVNEGLGMACNTGIEFATGEYIAFCDSDDWVDPNMYEQMYENAITYCADAVFTGLKRVDEYGKFCGVLPHPKDLQVLRGESEIHNLAKDIIASAPNVRLERSIQMSAKVVLYKREIIEKYNLKFVSEREIQSEDMHFNLSFLGHSNNVVVLPVYFYNYMVNANSISRKVKIDAFDDFINVYNYTLDECQELRIGGDYKKRVQRMFIGKTRSYINLICNSCLPINTKRSQITKVCRHHMWEDIWKEYPRDTMPLIHKMFSFAMKYNLFVAMYFMSKLKKA